MTTTTASTTATTTFDIPTLLKEFTVAFHERNSFKPPEFYLEPEMFADIYSRHIGELQNPILMPWWCEVTRDDVLANCTKSLANFFIPRLRNRGTAEARRIFKLGESYEKGDGVEKDLAVAFSHYMTAAEMGDVHAQVALGFALISGRFQTVDEKAGFEWFLEGASAGYPKAAYYTGLCYDRGIGVQKNDAFAKAYFEYAARHGDEDAQVLM